MLKDEREEKLYEIDKGILVNEIKNNVNFLF